MDANRVRAPEMEALHREKLLQEFRSPPPRDLWKADLPHRS